MDCSLPGSSTHGILQARILEWAAISFSKKEWNTAIYSNADGPREYYTEYNKSDRERQILYDITYMQDLKNNMNVYAEQK